MIIESFKKRGMLRGERGRVMVGRREALLEASCECYDIIRRNYEPIGTLES